LQDPVEVSRHPLGVIVVIVIITAIVFIRRVLLGHSLTPRLGSTFLEHLPLEVLPLLFLLFCILHRFVLLQQRRVLTLANTT